MSIEKRVMENGLTVCGKCKLVTRTISTRRDRGGRPPKSDDIYEKSSQNWKSIAVIYSRKGSVLIRIDTLNPGRIGITHGELVTDKINHFNTLMC